MVKRNLKYTPYTKEEMETVERNIEKFNKEENKKSFIAGIVIFVILFLAVLYYTNPDRRGGYYPDEIDDPCIAYNC